MQDDGALNAAGEAAATEEEEKKAEVIMQEAREDEESDKEEKRPGWARQIMAQNAAIQQQNSEMMGKMERKIRWQSPTKATSLGRGVG